jgi:hypothetical protein
MLAGQIPGRTDKESNPSNKITNQEIKLIQSLIAN